MGAVFYFTGDAISGSKISKFIVENKCSNGIKIEGVILVIDYYHGAEHAMVEKFSTNVPSLNSQIFLKSTV